MHPRPCVSTQRITMDTVTRKNSLAPTSPRHDTSTPPAPLPHIRTNLNQIRKSSNTIRGHSIPLIPTRRYTTNPNSHTTNPNSHKARPPNIPIHICYCTTPPRPRASHLPHINSHVTDCLPRDDTIGLPLPLIPTRLYTNSSDTHKNRPNRPSHTPIQICNCNTPPRPPPPTPLCINNHDTDHFPRNDNIIPPTSISHPRSAHRKTHERDAILYSPSRPRTSTSGLEHDPTFPHT